MPSACATDRNGRARSTGSAPVRSFTGSKASCEPTSLKVEHDATSGRFEEEVVWHDSYVAEQHVHHYGKSDAPVCWSLVGYASGYVSACLGQEIYFRETECLAQGAPTVLGRRKGCRELG